MYTIKSLPSNVVMHFDFSTEKKINVPNLWVINVSMNGSRITLVQNSISKAIFEFLPSLISFDIQSDNEFGVISIDIPSV